MLYEAELFVSSRALLSLEPRAGALERLASLFGFTTRLAEERRLRLAAAVERVLGALRGSGIDDAVFASRDATPCFVDRVGRGRDIDALAEPAGATPVDFDVLHLFVRETHVEADQPDPYRAAGTNEGPQLQLAVDVELHRVVPLDGYPLRLRVHGLIHELRAQPDESWDALAERTGRYIAGRFPDRRVHGIEGVPAEFVDRVTALARALSDKFGGEQIVDTAIRSALVLPRFPREGTLEELPAPLGAGSFARLPGLEDPLRYLFVWPEVHAGLTYEQILVLDGRGRRMLATGPSPVTATAEGILAPGHAPVELPVPDLLGFSGHEWEAEARREHLLAPGACCEGLDGVAALIAHERRKFECGSRGPARGTSAGGGGGDSRVHFPGAGVGF
ncbi:hypothetical protein [Enhygromyxa salina]|uniref:hypothetical protein n=1 Tax=Enhygromyxa salina TaxID=215803 RepID=UPI000D091E1D|nr:hypothetical protein [Enhygromyxa salina]